MQHSPLFILRMFSSLRKETLSSLAVTPSLFPSSSSPWKPLMLSISVELPSLHMLCSGNMVCSHCVWLPLLNDVFKIHLCCSMLVLDSFWCLNNIYLYGYTMFCFSIHYLMEIWVVCIFNYYE